MNTSFKHIIFLVLACLFHSIGWAQDLTQVNGWKTQISVAKDQKVMVKWLPSTLEELKLGLENGFSIKRYEIHTGENDTLHSQVISDQVKRINPFILSELLDFTRCEDKVLYYLSWLIESPDSVFNTADYKLGNDPYYDDVFYSDVVGSMVLRDELAINLGFGIIDTLGVQNKYAEAYAIEYRYEISIVGSPTSFVARANPMFPIYDFLEPEAFGISKEKVIVSKECIEYNESLQTIKLEAYAMEDSILLRWAPSDQFLWKELLNQGVVLKKLSVNDSGETYWKTISRYADSTFKKIPDSLLTQEWFSGDTLAMSVYSMINAKSSDVKPVEKAMELENKFGFSMLLAEKSLKAADLLGLLYVDREVEKGKTYNYLVEIPNNTSLMSSTNIIVENTLVASSPPKNLNSFSRENEITLAWPKAQKYSFYYIERATQEKGPFTPLFSEPLLYIDTDSDNSQHFTYTDTGLTVNTTYYYRLVGLNSFGQKSMYTMVSAKTIDLTPPLKPVLDSVLLNAEKQFTLYWKGDSISADLEKYYIIANGDYKTENQIVHEIKPKELSKTIVFNNDLILKNHWYNFKIIAIDKSGNQSGSDYFHLSVPDKTPPSMVANLKGAIDSIGNVYLVWDDNTEEDFFEYYVYHAIDTTTEMSRIDSSSVPASYFEYNLTLNDLNEDHYFGVVAADESFNLSKMAIIQLKLPDTLAPSAPLITKSVVIEESISLSWTESSAVDAHHYKIYYKNDLDSTWILKYDSIPFTTLGFTDTAIFAGSNHHYKMVLVDDAQNHSDFSNVRTEKLSIHPSLLQVTELKVSQDNQAPEFVISWKQPNLEDLKLINPEIEYTIYRSTGAGSPIIIKESLAATTSCSDSDISSGAIYTYQVQARIKNGPEGQLSAPVSVKLKSN